MNNEVRVKKAYYSYSNMPFSMKGEQRIMMQDWFRKARLGILFIMVFMQWGMCQNPGLSTTETFLMRII